MPYVKYHIHLLPITKWPHQSGAAVGAAPPTKSQRRLLYLLMLSIILHATSHPAISKVLLRQQFKLGAAVIGLAGQVEP
jgi:hypothetical protein